MDELDSLFKRTLEYENDGYEIYTSTETEILEKSCKRYFNGHPKLVGYRVRLVKSKENGSIIFVLYNKKGEPIAEDSQLDGMGMKIELMRFLKKRKN